MPDMATIASAFQGVQAIGTGVQTLLSLKEKAAIETKVYELRDLVMNTQAKLFEIQTDYAAALSRIRDLEKALADQQQWSLEKTRYELCEASPGTYTRRLKQSDSQGEPVHDLCVHCYEAGVKSILQAGPIAHGHETLVCPHCETSLLGKEHVWPRSRLETYDPFANI